MTARGLASWFLFAGVAFIGLSHAENAPPAGLDVRTAIIELQQAAAQIDGADIPLEHVDRLRKWDNLVISSRSIQDAVRAAIQSTDRAISSLQDSSEKYRSDPAKVSVLAKRIESLQGKADQLTLLDTELGKSITGLVARVEKVRADPEVQQALQIQNAMERTQAALDKASTAVPDALKP